MNSQPPIISTDWLAARPGQSGIWIADASWYLPDAGRNARSEYEAQHIPGAVFFDIDAISDHTTDLPHMLPDDAQFAGAVRKLGIGDRDFVVFYDGAGIYSSPRALWMMRAMGHDSCAVLDGGLPKWLRERRPVESGSPSAAASSHFSAKYRAEVVRGFPQMQANLHAREEQVLDARSPGRFRGEEPEPRPGVRPGHIPGSVNVHYAKLVTPEGTLRSVDELRRIFSDAGVNMDRPVATSCGSGITAAIVALGLEVAGARKIALYDGSWSEWGARPGAPVATGPA